MVLRSIAADGFGFGLKLFGLFFFHLGVGFFAADIYAQAAVEAHVGIGEPDEGEKADQVAAPVVQEKFVAGDDEEEERDPVAEAVFAGEEVGELANEKISAAI